MNVLVALINYKTPALTLRALRAVLAELASLPGSRVCLIDNGSGDDSVPELEKALEREGLGDRVDLVASPTNRGFAGGVNLALIPALRGPSPPRFVYLLNSDALPAPGSVATLVRFLEANPSAGIAGSYIHGPDGETHDTAFRFPGIASQFEESLGLGVVSRWLDRYLVSKPAPRETACVDWLAGASMLIRREVFDAIGVYDENFFFYYEETDFCRRAARAGFSTWYVPASRVEHIGAASSGWKDFSKPRAPYWWEGRRFYFYKNHGLVYLWAVNLAWLAGFVIGEPRRRLMGRRGPFPPRYFRDFLRHNFRFRPLGRGFPVLALAWLALAASAHAAPTASFTASRTERCNAPCAVLFDATATTDATTPHPFHQLWFDWDFGDERGESWSVSGKPKNRAIGGLAGHLYAHPGTFTVALRVVNPAGEAMRVTRTVRVDDPDAVFAGPKTRCVSVAGNFAGCPAGAQHVTSDDFDAQLANRPGHRTLLRRGETFRWSKATKLVDAGDVGSALDVFGSGAAHATLRAATKLALGPGAGWTVAHLALHGNGEAAPIAAVSARGGLRRFTVWDVDVRRFNNCVDFWSPDEPDSEVALVELHCSEFPDPGNGAKFYEDLDHSMILGLELDKGDHVAPDDQTEFAYRTVFSQKKLIQHGRFQGRGPNMSKNLLQLRHCSATGPWIARCADGAVPSRYVIVSDNHFIEGGGPHAITVIRVCDHAACTGKIGESQPVLDYVFERNLIQVAVKSATEQLGAVFQIQAKQTSVRNNVADLQGWPHGGSAKPIFVLADPLSNSARDGDGDVWISHNTIALGKDYPGSALLCAARGAKGALVCANNLFFAPGLAKSMTPVLGEWIASGNWVGEAAGASPFARPLGAPRTATLRDLGDFKLGDVAGPADAGSDLRAGGFARDDAFGGCRGATGKPDAGAHERGAPPCDTMFSPKPSTP